MRHSNSLNIVELVDRSKVGPSQIMLLVLCSVCLIMDGFDVQAMGYVAPAIIQDWKVDKASLGPVFGAGLLGMLVGSLAFSILADRIGRRPVLISGTIFFSVCMLLTPLSSSLTELLVVRFVTGLGLGSIMPNAMALAGEYSPKRIRVTLMMLVSCGFTMGAVLGGLISAVLIPAYGWQSVFYFGGIAPLLAALVMVVYLPESMQFLVLRGRKLDKVRAWLKRIAPDAQVDADTTFVLPEKRETGAPVVNLFREGRAATTMILWVINFMNLLDLYFLSNWIPTVFKEAGFSTADAVLAGTALQVGGVAGTLVMGRLIDRFGFGLILIPTFIVAGISIIFVGQPTASLALVFATIAIIGFCIVGGQPALNALAASYYPTSLRSTGVGWSLGIGRFGSVVGPVLGGELIRLNWPTAGIFLAVAVPAFITASMLVVMTVLQRSERVRSKLADGESALSGEVGEHAPQP